MSRIKTSNSPVADCQKKVWHSRKFLKLVSTGVSLSIYNFFIDLYLTVGNFYLVTL